MKISGNKNVNDKFEAYTAENGEYALHMHVYRTGNETPVSDIVPFLKYIEGRLVIVKSSDDKSVNLIDMVTLEAFQVPLSEYKKRCNNIWMLDEALMIYHPKEWEKQSKMVSAAYQACGLELASPSTSATE